MPTTHWYVDETKATDYVVVTVVAPTDVVSPARRALRELVRPGQRSLHFTKESDATRRAALRVIVGLPLDVIVYRVTGRRGLAAREVALRALARDALVAHPQRIVLERDDSVVVADRRWLRDELGPRNYRDIGFDHLAKHEEPMLWIADALAWCVQRGRPWSDYLDALSTVTTIVDRP
ncbi:hypothetical protein IC607_11475 [Cellulomonas sp. JH27-2]|uniref:hypothetical protein n=1 Tax=Cellulomonas sp. JH27-2 TaxID=2774139 RepID=UPI00177C1C49|nr:hypothetical protein [Cellulomonas sp. JH27-2]MBD8059585.1 hypothetical protein [Cellulomonas sp. JH27-2]